MWLVVLTTFLDATVCADLVEIDSGAGKRIFHFAADFGDGADRRVRRARPCSCFTSSGKPR